MNLDKLEALIKNMTAEQYLRFESAVFDLLKENKLFSSNELLVIEKKIQLKKQVDRKKVLVTNN